MLLIVMKRGGVDLEPSRSYKSLTFLDLRRLAEIARLDREDLFACHTRYAVLRERIIAVALCQGAALHFIDGENGIKDFDVWTFYAAHPVVTYPPRRTGVSDFGDAKFGTSPDRPDFVGRRVDLLGRSLNVRVGDDPFQAIRDYLHTRKTATAVALAQKAVVLIEPGDSLGTVIWPLNA